MPSIRTLCSILPFVLAACVPAGPTNADAADQGFAPPRAADRPADLLQPGPDGHRSVALGVLSTEEPAVLDGLGPFIDVDLRGVAAEVERNAGYLQRCYEGRLREAPGLKGAVSIHAHITPQGVVDGQCITDDTMQDPVIAKCVNDTIAMGRYPAGHPETVDVTFPFVFSPPNS